MGKVRVKAVALVGCVVLVLACLGQAAAAEAAEPEKPKTALKELEGGLVAIDVSGLANSDGITSEDDRNDADFDEWKQSFDAEELPKAGKLQPKGTKAVFLFPTKEAGKKNNVACAGQKIPVGLKAAQLHLLVTATDGNQEDKLTIEYADGKVQVDLKVTDWCQKAAFGEKASITCASRVAIGVGGPNARGKEERETHIWIVSVPLDAKRELKTLSLPWNSLIHVFALTLAK